MLVLLRFFNAYSVIQRGVNAHTYVYKYMKTDYMNY